MNRDQSLPLSMQIHQLEHELKELKDKELQQRKARLWAQVKDLSQDDLKLLEWIIHVHFYGDGEDD